MADFCARRNLKKADKETYCHPFLRAVSNWHLLNVYANILRSGCTIFDIACKYHHVVSWLTRVGPLEGITSGPKVALLARPNVMGLDVAYNKRYSRIRDSENI